jgi:hypothetical protein
MQQHVRNSIINSGDGLDILFRAKWLMIMIDDSGRYCTSWIDGKSDRQIERKKGKTKSGGHMRVAMFDWDNGWG